MQAAGEGVRQVRLAAVGTAKFCPGVRIQPGYPRRDAADSAIRVSRALRRPSTSRSRSSRPGVRSEGERKHGHALFADLKGLVGAPGRS